MVVRTKEEGWDFDSDLGSGRLSSRLRVASRSNSCELLSYPCFVWLDDVDLTAVCIELDSTM